MAAGMISTGLVLAGFWIGVALTEHTYKDQKECDRFRIRTAYDRQAELERENEILTRQNRRLSAQHLRLFEREVAR